VSKMMDFCAISAYYLGDQGRGMRYAARYS
jgi:hypothetical protein